MVSFSLVVTPRPLWERPEASRLRPLPSETERDRDRVPAGTWVLERMLRPLSLTDTLEKEGWRTEKLRIDIVDAIVVTVGKDERKVVWCSVKR